MSVASLCCTGFCVVVCVKFCSGRFVMMPINLTYLHCLQHSLFEHLFNLYIRYHASRQMKDYTSTALTTRLNCQSTMRTANSVFKVH